VVVLNNILRWLAAAEDRRQPWKVKHLMRDIIAIVFFALLANADDWMSIELFAVHNEKFLRKYLELPNGIPSHDTIQRVFATLSPDYLQEFRRRWDQVMSGNTGNRIKKLLGIDGKTQRGNGTSTQKANHIVSAVDARGFCVGEVRVDEKSNEITAIPELLRVINVKGHIVTIDAMGCQTDIAALIIKKRGDYVLALKGNQSSLHDDVKLYFADPELLSGCSYSKTVEKARSNIEKREYWQTDDISWLSQKPDWAGLRSIAMTKNTITKSDGSVTTEVRYYISSLNLNVEMMAWSIRGHWMVESYHWHLDVTFREDANLTLERDSAYNLNIMKKMAINTLKLVDIGMKKKVSLRGKRLVIGWDFGKHFDTIMGI
jgi:predicted transposase YbfD/YdcC